MRTVRLVGAGALGFAVGLAPLPARATPMFVPLEIPVGFVESGVVAISADGSTPVGGALKDFFNFEFAAVRWTQSGTPSLLTPPPLPPDPPALNSASFAVDVSGNGSKIVGDADTSRAFTWTEAGAFFFDTKVNGISDDGDTIVGEDDERPYRDRSTGPFEPLPLPTGSQFGRADAVSANGNIVAGTLDVDNGPAEQQAVVWDAAGTPTLAPPNANFANDISADGTTVVGLSEPGENADERAFRWNLATNTVEILEALPLADIEGRARGVSADGSTVVGASGDNAVLWDENGQVSAIADILTDLGLGGQLAGWGLREAIDVSGDGTVIVGDGINPGGQRQSWLAVIADLPPTDFVWSGACGNGNWHSDCPESNWNDVDGNPAGLAPGDRAGTESALIINTPVRLDNRAVNLLRLEASGSLEIAAPIHVDLGSSAENITISSDLATDAAFTLISRTDIVTPTTDRWLSGRISGAGPEVAAGTSALVVGPTAALEISGGDKVLETNLVVEGGGSVVQSDGQLIIGNGGQLETKPNAAYVVQSGAISSVKPIVNAGGFFKTAGVGSYEVTIDAPFENHGGRIQVDAGRLTLTGQISHDGGIYRIEQDAFLDLHDAITEVDGTLNVTGDGNLELTGGLFTVKHGATASFGLSGPGGLTLRDDSELQGIGTIKNLHTTTIVDATVSGTFVNAPNASFMFGGDFNTNPAGAVNTIDGTFLNRGIVSQRAPIAHLEFRDTVNDGVLHNMDGGVIEQRRNIYLVDGIIMNDPGGIYDLKSGNLAGDAIKRDNAFLMRGGVLKKSVPTGGGDSSFGSISVPFIMTGGAAIVESGELSILELRLEGGGTFEVDEGAALFLSHDISTPPLRGIYQIDGRGEVSVGSFFKTEGDLTVNMHGPGKTVFDGISIGGFGHTGTALVNEGNAELVDGFFGKLKNEGHAILRGRIGGTQVVFQNVFENTGTVDHTGTLKVSFGSDGNDFVGAIVNSGLYNLSGSFSSAGLDPLANDGTILNQLDGVFAVKNFGDYRGYFDNQGTFEVVEDVEFDLRGNVRQLDLINSTLTGGTWVIKDGAMLTFQDDSVRIGVNGGNVVMHGTGRLNAIPNATNSSDQDFLNNGLFSLRDEAVFFTSRDFTNQRVLFIDSSSALKVNGLFESSDDAVNIIDGMMITQALSVLGGGFGGVGTIDGDRFDNIGGVVGPGGSPGILEFTGSYNQAAEGTLEIELGGLIAGLEYDRFVVGGTATFEVGNGILIDLIDPSDEQGLNVFEPQAGDFFDIVTAREIALLGTSDVFDLLNLPELPTGLFFEAAILETFGRQTTLGLGQTILQQNILRLSIGGERSSSGMVPEPGSLLLLVVGLVGIVVRRVIVS